VAPPCTRKRTRLPIDGSSGLINSRRGVRTRARCEMIESDPNASPASKASKEFRGSRFGARRAPPSRRDKGTIRRTCCASSVLRSNCNGAQLSARAFTSPRARAV